MDKMTDAELIEAVATEIMWPGEVIIWLAHPGQWQCLIDRYYNNSTFNPITNLNHAFMVVEKMRELEWELILESHRNTIEKIYWVIFWKKFPPLNTKREIAEIRGLPGRAICEAALQAVREMK